MFTGATDAAPVLSHYSATAEYPSPSTGSPLASGKVYQPQEFTASKMKSIHEKYKTANKLETNENKGSYDTAILLCINVVKICTIALSSITASIMAGWFATSDSLIRVIAGHAFKDVGISVVMAALLYVLSGLISATKANNKIYAVITCTIISLWISIGTFYTFGELIIILNRLQGIPFKQNLTPSDMNAAIGEVFESADLSKTMIFGPIRIFTRTSAIPKNPRLSFTDYAESDEKFCKHFIGVPHDKIDAQTITNKITGHVISFNANSIKILSGNNAMEIDLFGISIDKQNNDFASSMAASGYFQIADTGNGRAPNTDCEQSKLSGIKWICSVGDFDISQIMIAKGAAKPDEKALHGSPLELPYLEAQMSAQEFGCGIWRR